MTGAARELALTTMLVLLAPSRMHADTGARSLGDPVQPRGATASHDFALDLLADATLPLSLGARVALEVPGHFLFYVTAGAVAAPFVDAILDVGTGWGAFSDRDAQVCRTLLGGATLFEAGLGLRPAGTPGIEISVGYVLLWSHRTVSPEELGLPTLASTTSVPALGLDLAIDAIHVELAWQTQLLDIVTLRISAGWLHAFEHQVSLVAEQPSPDVAATLDTMEARLALEVGRRAFGPTVGLALGFRLF